MEFHQVYHMTQLQSARRPQFSACAEVNHAPGGYVYTIGILYRQIPRWQTLQLVNSIRRYLSTRPVRSLLNQELLEVWASFLVNFRHKSLRLLALSSMIEWSQLRNSLCTKGLGFPYILLTAQEVRQYIFITWTKFKVHWFAGTSLTYGTRKGP